MFECSETKVYVVLPVERVPPIQTGGYIWLAPPHSIDVHIGQHVSCFMVVLVTRFLSLRIEDV